jgi:uncharacterized protein YnzC (UPF0291/DUF896 family)|tara:strand:+ start:964 stop:1140 length:177 start_codon:yes stop_codon:yes gene_type:complete
MTEIEKPDVPYIQQLKKRVHDAEHVIKAILVRGSHVTPTYLSRLAQDYAEKYNITEEN